MLTGVIRKLAERTFWVNITKPGDRRAKSPLSEIVKEKMPNENPPPPKEGEPRPEPNDETTDYVAVKITARAKADDKPFPRALWNTTVIRAVTEGKCKRKWEELRRLGEDTAALRPARANSLPRIKTDLEELTEWNFHPTNIQVELLTEAEWKTLMAEEPVLTTEAESAAEDTPAAPAPTPVNRRVPLPPPRPAQLPLPRGPRKPQPRQDRTRSPAPLSSHYDEDDEDTLVESDEDKRRVRRRRRGDSRRNRSQNNNSPARSVSQSECLPPRLRKSNKVPKLSRFHGGPAESSKEGSYVSVKKWLWELTTLYNRDVYSETALIEAITNSVSGPAADTIMALGPDFTVWDVLQKIKTVFGHTHTRGALQSRFWTHTQGPRDSVATFATKLESLMADLFKLHPEEFDRENVEQDLRDRFFLGLKSSLREAIRYRYDRGNSFEKLLAAARQAEQEQRQEARQEGRSQTKPLYTFSRAAKVTQEPTMVRPADDDEDEEEDEEEKKEDSSSREEQEFLEQVLVQARAAFQARRSDRSEQRPARSGEQKPRANREDILPGDQRKCNRCQGWGHFARDCATKKEVDLNAYTELSLGGEPVLRRKPAPTPPSSTKSDSSQ